VLMIDARSIHRKVTRNVNDFSPEQLQNIASIVWLHRGETDRYLALVRDYLTQANESAVALKEPLDRFAESMSDFVQHLQTFGKSLSDRNGEDEEAVSEFRNGLSELAESWKLFQDEHSATVKAIDKHAKWLGSANLETNKQQHTAHDRFEPVSTQIRSLSKLADRVIKAASTCHDVATKKLASTKSDTWKTADIRNLHKDLIRTPKDGDEENLRVLLLDLFKQPPYFQRQTHWMQSKFPEGKYADVEGLCKSVDRAAIQGNDWSLTPGRYVGVAAVVEDADFDFVERMEGIRNELELLSTEAMELAEQIDLSLLEVVQ